MSSGAAPARLDARLRAKVGKLELDVELQCGAEVLLVVGPNGAGKSSLLKLLLGVHPVVSGELRVDEHVLLDTRRKLHVPVEQRRLGYVPQAYALFPHLSVRGNLEFALAAAGEAPPLQQTEASARLERLMNELELLPLADRRPYALSGGEQQRVALARALITAPRALLLDEPLAALDVTRRREVRQLLARTLQRLGLPTLLVTHDAADARYFGARIVVLERGRITQLGTWTELLQNPASRFVEEFVAD